MFENNYKRDNEKITADPALKAYLKSKITNRHEQSPQKKAPRILKTALALSLCLCIGLGSVLLHNRIARFNIAKKPINQIIEIDPNAPLTSVNYGDLYKIALKSYSSQRIEIVEDIIFESATNGTNLKGNGAAAEGDIAINDISKPDDNGSSPEAEDYSETNNQVSGVDEGDIIKTDGKYIYLISDKSKTLNIIKAENGNMELMSKTSVNDTEYYCGSGAELYVFEDNIAIVSSCYKSSTDKTTVQIFNTQNKSEPTLVKTFSQDGFIRSSRLIGNTLYVLSDCNPYQVEPIEQEKETYVPKIYNDDTLCLVDESSIYIHESCESYQYFMAASYNIEDLAPISSIAAFGQSDIIYMSTESLYVGNSRYDNSESANLTDLSRFSLNGGNLKLEAQGSVLGHALNQFSLDEYNGNLRIVTTVNRQSEKNTSVSYVNSSGEVETQDVATLISTTDNSLYILDLSLNVIGKIENLAENERVYSVRFMGNTGYFVTFRQTDPLFSVDLSDPANPTVLGELKIPGFSKYLHPFGSGLLFGLGQDANITTGATKGVKISMFNTTDPKNVTEQHKLLLPDSYSAAEYNHKALLISVDKNLICFPGENSFHIYSYSADSGFTQKAEVEFNAWDSNSRILYIGDYIYVYYSGQNIKSINMTDFTVANTLAF